MGRIEVDVAKMKVEFENLKDTVDIMSSKMDDIHIALLGDGKQNRGALSRIQTLEQNFENFKNNKSRSTKFWRWLLGILLAISSTILGIIALSR